MDTRPPPPALPALEGASPALTPSPPPAFTTVPTSDCLLCSRSRQRSSAPSWPPAMSQKVTQSGWHVPRMLVKATHVWEQGSSVFRRETGPRSQEPGPRHAKGAPRTSVHGSYGRVRDPPLPSGSSGISTKSPSTSPLPLIKVTFPQAPVFRRHKMLSINVIGPVAAVFPAMVLQATRGANRFCVLGGGEGAGTRM